MEPLIPLTGRVSGQKLVALLGNWRQGGSRHGAADLAAAVQLLVLDGRLPLGTKLPAERELADALEVSRTLIGAALDKLRADGLVASRRGAGSWIASPGGQGRAPFFPSTGDFIDLAVACPPAIAGMAGCVDAARRALGEHLGGSGMEIRGLWILRERIARRYTERGLPTNPDQVMITNGAHNAFVQVLRMLAGPGDRVLVEQPSYPNTLEAISAAHAIPIPVPLDPVTGWDVGGIEAALRQSAPRFALFVPDFQNPTGLRMDAENRERLAAALSRARTPVVIDETLAELDLEGDPVDGPPPMGLFAGDLGITIGSASKSHWAGLRLGWIRASGDIIGRLVGARFAVDLGSPVFEQLVLAELLDDGGAALVRRREEIRALRDALTGALNWYCPEWTFAVPRGGLSLWCRLPEATSTRLAVAAANHGVQIAPGSRFGVHGGLERWLRLPFALPADRLFEAVRRLGVASASVSATLTTLAPTQVT